MLKRNRGNGGEGVWKLEDVGGGQVRVTAAAGDRTPVTLGVADFLDARAAEFVAAGGYLDQAYQQRLGEGMVRCYMSANRLVGFGSQKVRALLDAESAPPRTYSGPDDPCFQTLRRRMEGVWTPGPDAPPRPERR